MIGIKRLSTVLDTHTNSTLSFYIFDFSQLKAAAIPLVGFPKGAVTPHETKLENYEEPTTNKCLTHLDVTLCPSRLSRSFVRFATSYL